ncbi:MAG: hypothetical protein WC476_01380 [Phycisphaerae bacterium]|jgi:hypothetical protein
MFIYLILPVRNVEEKFSKAMDGYVGELESKGNVVHYPPRDTNQEDITGYNICWDHFEAMESCDEVHVAWDGKSQGCLFDLGMAFALNKKVIVIEGYFPEATEGKSYQSMVREWQRRYVSE